MKIKVIIVICLYKNFIELRGNFIYSIMLVVMIEMWSIL